MLRNRGLAFKLILLILSSCILIFTAILEYNYFISKKIIIKNIEENAKNLSLATINRIESVLNPVEKVAENLASVLETEETISKEKLNEILKRTIENNPEIYGSTAAFEPYMFDRDSLYYAPYYFRNTDQDRLKFTYIGGKDYVYFGYDWYQIPKELGRPNWCEPYFDEGAGNIIMSTYSVPFYRVVEGKKKFAGVVTADISLEWLREIVSSIKIFQSGYGFLISRSGTIVTHPRADLIMNETIFSIAEERNDLSLREIGRKMVRGNSGFVSTNLILTNEKAWMSYEPLPSSGWSLGVFFPLKELLADLHSLNRTLILLNIFAFIVLGLIIIFITGSITSPLCHLAKAIEKVGKGDLDAEIPVIKSKDEVGMLAESFVSMKNSLKEYIQQLKETTATKERIESELKIAHDIQMGIIPRTFPPFPERKEFDVYAIIETAKEVGGDFYDFFFIDDDNLCFCIGDVSGKGVPASLFMAVTRTIIKTKTIKGLTPDKVLSRVNEDLCIDNPSLMFATVCVAILNTRTGELSYSLGGHNLPYILLSNGEIREFEKTKGMALGVMEDCVFEAKKITLNSGDGVYLYTDGVNEAMDTEDNQYGCKRLEEYLKSVNGTHPEEITVNSLNDVKKFAAGAPQSDDITILVLKYN